MKRGDKIVSVNGIDLSRATHEDAAIALKNAGNTVALRLFYSPEDYERFEAKIHSIKNQVRWKLYFNKDSKDSNGWAKKWTPGLVNFVPAVAYNFCINLPEKFSQPGDHF